MYTEISYTIETAVKHHVEANIGAFSGCSIDIMDSGAGRPVIRAYKDGYCVAMVYAPAKGAPLSVSTYDV